MGIIPAKRAGRLAGSGTAVATILGPLPDSAEEICPIESPVADNTNVEYERPAARSSRTKLRTSKFIGPADWEVLLSQSVKCLGKAMLAGPRSSACTSPVSAVVPVSSQPILISPYPSNVLPSSKFTNSVA